MKDSATKDAKMIYATEKRALRTVKDMEWLPYKVQSHCLGLFMLEKKLNSGTGQRSTGS